MRDSKQGYSVDHRLTGLVRIKGNSMFAYDQIAPAVPVPQKEGKYYDLGTEHDIHVRTVRAEGTRPGRVGNTVSTVNYTSVEHRLETVVPEEHTMDGVDQAVRNFNAATTRARLLKHQVQIAKEVELATLLGNNANYGSSNKIELTDAEDKFTDPASDPVGLFQDIVNRLKIVAGVRESDIVAAMRFDVRSALRQHPGIRASLGLNTNGLLTKEQLLAALGIGDIIELDAVYRTSKSGQADARGQIWGPDIIVFKRSVPAVSMEDGEQRFVFSAQAPIPRSPTGAGVVESMVDDTRYCTNVRYGESAHPNFHDADCGYLIENAI